MLTGDGSEQLEEKSWLKVASPATRLQNGTGICLAVQDGTRWISPDALMPEYLQLVKAEKDLQDKKAAK